LRIAVVTVRGLSGSGFATRVTSMLSAYVALGHEVDVVHYRFPHEAPLPDAIARALRLYVEVPLRTHRVTRHLALDPPLARECAMVVSRPPLDRYDVVQAETSCAWRVARRVEANRHLLVLHDDDDVRLRSLARATDRHGLRAAWMLAAKQYRRLQRQAIVAADGVWFASAADRDRLVGRAVFKGTVIPNGAGDELWSLPEIHLDGPPEALYVGPGSYPANREGLVWFVSRVWPIVRDAVRDAHLRVVGDGWGRFPSTPGVEFLGWRPSLLSDYERSRLVVAPVFAGGGTNVKVIEGMAAGRPVVTTTFGSQEIPHAVGLVVEDDPSRFAEAVIALLANGELAADVGRVNRRRVAHLRWSRIWRLADAGLADLVRDARTGAPATPLG
jgi:glycosyltransferase involved in cell wall biosynthesis